MKINVNEWDIELAQKEGLKKQVNIGQIKEIRKHTLRKVKEVFMVLTLEEIMEFFEKKVK